MPKDEFRLKMHVSNAMKIDKLNGVHEVWMNVFVGCVSCAGDFPKESIIMVIFPFYKPSCCVLILWLV